MWCQNTPPLKWSDCTFVVCSCHVTLKHPDISWGTALLRCCYLWLWPVMWLDERVFNNHPLIYIHLQPALCMLHIHEPRRCECWQCVSLNINRRVHRQLQTPQMCDLPPCTWHLWFKFQLRGQNTKLQGQFRLLHSNQACLLWWCPCHTRLGCSHMSWSQRTIWKLCTFSCCRLL